MGLLFINIDITFLIIVCFKIAIFIGPIIGIIPFIVLLERKMAGWIQVRPGPNRVGPFGLLQGIVDGVKVFLKEDITPKMADKPLYYMAPVLLMAPVLICLSVIPFGPTVIIPKDLIFLGKYIGGRTISFSITDIPIGLIFIFAVSSIGVYGIVFAGWSSNSKYSLLGGVRSAAQLISYDIALLLSVAGVIILSESLNLREIADAQGGGFWNWYIWKQPLAFLIFLTAIFAETNRLPFDIPEGEAEITGGYHTEYSSMKFALFFLGEYLAMILMSALGVTLFFGGWKSPIEFSFLNIWWINIISGMLWFGMKVLIFILFFIYIRWTLPRFRFDQLLSLGWKLLFLGGIINLILTAGLTIAEAPTILYLIDGLIVIFIFDYYYTKKRRREIKDYIKLTP